MNQWKKTSVANDGTHHLKEGIPLYDTRFVKVLKYHAPGIAPVIDNSGAYHIDLHGHPVYSHRYLQTFGFYEGLAAVKATDGWFHISLDGTALYKRRFKWCGNFQERCCSVKSDNNTYFHINNLGDRIYEQNYQYVGDFKEGMAVVCREDGKHTHINAQGNLTHQQWFYDLDIYHKGSARARDDRGWFHIDQMGREIYSRRFASIEPYYNDVARIETFEGALLTIDIEGNTLYEIRPASTNPLFDLSGDMVGFWKTETICAAVQLGVPPALPGSTEEIASRTGLPLSKTKRLLRALWELDIVDMQEQWELTRKGVLLTPSSSPMSCAAKMWSTLNSSIWKSLPKDLQSSEESSHPSFKDKESDLNCLGEYLKVIDRYAEEDYQDVANHVEVSSTNTILGVSRTGKTLLNMFLKKSPHLTATLLGDKRTLSDSNLPPSIDVYDHDIKTHWPIQSDLILLPRVLHLYPDREAKTILTHAKNALTENGMLCIIELLLGEDHPGASLLDMNMLVETGGKERSLREWKALFNSTDLDLQHLSKLSGMNHVMTLKRTS